LGERRPEGRDDDGSVAGKINLCFVAVTHDCVGFRGPGWGIPRPLPIPSAFRIRNKTNILSPSSGFVL
jgi:hypothetical protein